MTLLMTRKGRRVAVAGMSFMVTQVRRMLAAVRMTDHWKMSRSTRGLNTSHSCCCAVVGHNTSTTAADSRQSRTRHREHLHFGRRSLDCGDQADTADTGHRPVSGGLDGKMSGS